MSAAAMVLLAGATLIGPPPRGHFRFRSVLAPTGGRRPARDDPRRWAPLVVAVVVTVALLAGAVGLAVALGVAGGTGLWLLHRGVRDRAARERDETVMRAMGTIVAELSIGSPTADACARAGAEILLDDPSSRVGRDLEVLAARVRLGGEAGASGAGEARRIAALWTVAAHHGLPLGELVAASRTDLSARLRFAAHTRAGLAGPRATARVLAVLPMFGLLLGQGIGADPLRVLLAPGAGSVLLVLGTGLAAVGVVWSERIVERVLR
ncbi:type II secretion system F family protein [Gordonia crocea]|uniref:Type II secretion system protein GspF domain-containing protein n=1 Tax=Gordonia crocea TaxID=589162 RepID=A0A7M3SV86_9ACTN|nr:hypothetical protein [Gordonia crocea]GED96560.1 hypothetical protein nbrc107697_05990 [Gordonia crocea]